MVILPQEIALQLNSLLQLPASGQEQDWEIELADCTRLLEFIAFHNTADLNAMQRYGVGLLILASYDDYLKENADEDHAIWSAIESIIAKENEQYTGILRYWACLRENEDAGFAISASVRAYLKNEDDGNIAAMAAFLEKNFVRTSFKRSLPPARERNGLIALFVDAVFGSPDNAKVHKPGCSDDEIAALEAHFNFRLPRAYRVFLSIMGHGTDNYEVGTDYTYNWLFDQTKYANELLDEKNILPMPPNAFAFSMHQGYQFCCFFVEEGIDDPSVFYYHEGYASKGLIKVTNHLTEYLMSPAILEKVFDEPLYY